MTLTKFNILATLLMLSIIISLASCSALESPKNISPVNDNNQIILATTTSTQDSGLLDFLLPTFQEKSGFIVKTIAVGTGKALKMAEDGNADILLVHAPSAEKELIDNGFGIDRSLVMHNDFVIVGPPNDPAGISGMKLAIDAFQQILKSNSQFVTRGDDSGTHKKELTFWIEIDDIPKGNQYLETGQGMAATLRIASEKGAYTLTDRATLLTNQDFVDLAILVEGDNQLLNVYHVISVNPTIWPQVNYPGAQAFTSYLLAAETQVLIGDLGVDLYDQPLFFPDAGKTESELGIE
jgi:tungstate transport system substrate-binding protein